VFVPRPLDHYISDILLGEDYFILDDSTNVSST
jgi:hypothetical protein